MLGKNPERRISYSMKTYTIDIENERLKHYNTLNSSY